MMLARTLGMAIGLMSAIAVSQFPEYAQQYRQRLGGAIDELRRVVGAFDRDAASAGVARGDALDRMARSGDELQRRQSASMADHAARLDTLEHERQDLRDAGPFQRLLIFATRSDGDIARRAFDDFEPAVPTTPEGAAAAAAGFFAGWGLMRLLARAFRRKRPAQWRRA